MSKNIGFLSFRIAGTDGVSLETAKWAQVLERLGHECYYCAGELDTPGERSHLVPQAQFKHPDIQEFYPELFSQERRPRHITARIHELREALKKEIYEFLERFAIDVLVPQNTLTIPLNIPLGLAITEVIAETGIPTIAHHHDFFWERQRFLTNCVWDYLRAAFPPRLGEIRHVVINSSGRNQLALRSGANSYLIPNVMDFANPPPAVDGYNGDLRQALGLDATDRFVLQPTRVVQRKGIEHAIELVKRLDDQRAVLVISHASGDEGFEYEQRVRSYAELLGIRSLFVDHAIDHSRGTAADGSKVYSLADVYPHADLVTYPSLFEGFGNAFLEAVWHRKPVFVNNYSVYKYDIRPRGFQAAEMTDYITDAVVEDARRFLDDESFRTEAMERNYQIGKRFFSYEVLESDLEHILMEIYGVSD